MIAAVAGLLRQWLSQDVARTNAAQASVRLQHRRREVEDVEAFLATQHHRAPKRPVDRWPGSAARAREPRHGPDS
jgi:hypothetical protein